MIINNRLNDYILTLVVFSLYTIYTNLTKSISAKEIKNQNP